MADIPSFRIGQGYDVHAFGAGDHVMLGGVRVPHGRGVVAHSDGDVALHALCDAILGALALGDIGVHFPPSDERWRDADSLALVDGTEIDFVKQGLNEQFVFRNPNVAGECGCGESFHV